MPGNQVVPTVRGDPKPLGEVISKLVDRYQNGKFFNPWSVRLPDGAEREQYKSLVTLVGPRYARCTLESFRVDEQSTQEDRPSQCSVKEQLAQFVDDMPARLRYGAGVVLYGRPGTGKDHLLLAMAYEAILNHGWSVKWVNGLDLYMEARRLIEKKEDERKFCAKFCEPHILIISDPVPPKGDASNFNADLVFRILDRRYRDLKSTWATINVQDGKEAEERLASSIVDRLRHGSLCLECNWPSHRKPAREVR